MGSYVPSSEEERKSMLAAVGAETLDDLYESVPREVYLKEPVIPAGLSELEVLRDMSAMAEKDTVYKTVFRGAGAYRHYIPSIVKTVIGKEAFRTTYTPYQAEISQGILQSIFEYQTMICELTGMDVSNASVYDGASAAAESVFMCLARKKTKAVVAGTAHPQVIERRRRRSGGPRGSAHRRCGVPLFPAAQLLRRHGRQRSPHRGGP